MLSIGVNQNLNLRVRTNLGIFQLPTLLKSHNMLDLKKKISDITGYSVDAISLMKGFPPKPLDYIGDEQILAEIPLSTGDVLVVTEAPQQSKTNPLGSQIPSTAAKSKGILIKRVVPADNSCLFTSVNFLLGNGTKLDLSQSCVSKYRRIVADTVKAFDPSNSKHLQNSKNPKKIRDEGQAFVKDYDSEDSKYLSDLLVPAILGKPTNSEYGRWIMSPQSWGGAIELAILSRHFALEIVVVDVRSARLERFGQGAGYTRAIVLLYDGIHYDPLILEEPTRAGLQPVIQTIFDTVDAEAYEAILEEALDMARQARSAHQYTAVDTFSLKCYECDTILTGETGAQDHAKKTGHVRFGEIDRS